MNLVELKNKYESACNEYVKIFAQKQGIEFDGWVSNEVGGMACFGGMYFFSMSDITLDIDTKQSKGLILEWQSESVDYNMFNEHPQHINYKSYSMGLRYEQLKNDKRHDS